GLAAVADDIGDAAATRSFSEASVAIWRELGDANGLARALHNLALAEASTGDAAAASALLREALGHARTGRDNRLTSRSLASLAALLIERGEFAAARPLLEEGLAVARAARDWSQIAETTTDLGWVTLELGDTTAAGAYWTESLALLGETGRRRVAVFAIEGCAVLAATAGQPAQAARLVASAAAVRDEMGIPADRDPRLTFATASTAVQILRRLIEAGSAEGPVWSMDEALREAAAVVQTPPAPDAPPAASARPDDLVARSGLTPREVEVLRLPAAGRSARPPAAPLFITPRPAPKHVGATPAKLGAPSRAEAAARAVRDGLA